MNPLYSRVKTVLEWLGWREVGPHHWYFSNDLPSINRDERNPLTHDVVHAIEEGLWEKSQISLETRRQSGYSCMVMVDTGKGYQRAFACSDTYGVAQLECAELVMQEDLVTGAAERDAKYIMQGSVGESVVAPSVPVGKPDSGTSSHNDGGTGV